MRAVQEAAARVIAGFRKNVAAVEELLDFDRFILDFAIEGMRSAAAKLRDELKAHNAAKVVENRLGALETVRRHDSLRPKYQTIFNQCVVLLVSYFGSTLPEIFCAAVSYV